MTREEAIEWLNRELKVWEKDCLSKHPIKEALSVAIEALEQEPSGSTFPNKSEIQTGSIPKNDLGVDCIDKTELLKAMDTWDKFGNDPNEGLIPLRTPALQDRYVPYVKYDDMVKCVKGMPSVTPIRPKGQWIWVFDETPSTPNSPYEVNYAGWVCSCCHKFPDDICEWDDPDEPPTYKYCPNCGADMREVEE